MSKKSEGAPRSAPTRIVFIAYASFEELLTLAYSGDILYLLPMKEVRIRPPFTNAQLYVMAQIVRHGERVTEVHYCRVNAGGFQRLGAEEYDEERAQRSKAETLTDRLLDALRKLATRTYLGLRIVKATVLLPEGDQALAGEARQLRYVKAEKEGEVGTFEIAEPQEGGF